MDLFFLEIILFNLKILTDDADSLVSVEVVGLRVVIY